MNRCASLLIGMLCIRPLARSQAVLPTCACDIPEDQESVLDCLRPLIEEHYWTEFNAYPQDIRPVSGALTKLKVSNDTSAQIHCMQAPLADVHFEAVHLSRYLEKLPCFAQRLEFDQVQSGQMFQYVVPGLRKVNPRDPTILNIGLATDKTSSFCTIHKTNCRMMPKLKMLSNLPNCRKSGTWMSAHGEEHLVLGRCEPGFTGLRFAPMEEAAKTVPKCEYPSIVFISECGLVGVSHHIPSN